MKTINAKQLRYNLEETFDDVLGGQDIIVTYRSKQPIRITASMQNNSDKKKLAGLAAFDAATKKPVKYNKNANLKDLYKQSLIDKYGKN